MCPACTGLSPYFTTQSRTTICSVFDPKYAWDSRHATTAWLLKRWKFLLKNRISFFFLKYYYGIYWEMVIIILKIQCVRLDYSQPSFWMGKNRTLYSMFTSKEHRYWQRWDSIQTVCIFKQKKIIKPKKELRSNYEIEYGREIVEIFLQVQSIAMRSHA